MNIILSEKDYQNELLDYLVDEQGYTRRTDKDFDRRFAIDPEMLFTFLEETQGETMEALRKIHKAALRDTILGAINTEATKKGGSLISVLKHGVEISNMTLTLMYSKPATSFNPELSAQYAHNTLSLCQGGVGIGL